MNHLTPRHVLQLITALGVALCLAGLGGIVYHGCINSWAYDNSIAAAWGASRVDFTLDRMLADKLLFLGAVGLALLAARIMLSLQWRGEAAHQPLARTQADPEAEGKAVRHP